MGLTIAAPRFPERGIKGPFWLLAGGPLATLGGTIVGGLVWVAGTRSDLLLAWIAVSMLLSLDVGFPYRVKSGQLFIASDAAQLIDLLRRGRASRQQPPGQTLSSLNAVSDLLQRVGATSGAAYYRLLRGTVEIVLGDLASARESLAIGRQCDPGEFAGSVALASYLEALIAIKSRNKEAPRLGERARQLSRGDEQVCFVLEVLELAQRIEHGEASVEGLHALRERVSHTSRDDWMCTVDMLLFRFDPPDDPDSGCRDLLVRYRLRVAPLGPGSVVGRCVLFARRAAQH